MPAADHIDTEFWGDRLEVNTDLVLRQHEDDDFVEKWVDGIKMRARAVLAGQLGIDGELGVRDTRKAILERRDELVEYRLAEAAVAGRLSYAILEVARAKLPEADVERCHENEDRYDRIGLTWLLYANDPRDLELVFHLDRTQRKGFARMVLEDLPETDGVDPADFFDADNLQQILDEFEEEKKTLRQSHCAAVLHNGGNYQLFIKRDMKPGFVSHGAKNIFGFEREWIILEFEPDLRRVLICSVSPDTPLMLANRIAGVFFGTGVEYDNELIVTPAAKVSQFLKSLLADPDKLPLVEVTAANCGLDGSPQLRLNDQDNESLAPAVQQFASAFGNPFDNVADIESIKVHKFKKRVKMIFEPEDEAGEAFIVRYADQPLNGKERREFEKMMEDEYKITVLSTEKRYAR